MLTPKIIIERLNHYEQENKELTERIEFYQRKTQRLEKRNKEIYEGFITTTQELCDTTKELEDYKSRCEKAIERLTLNGDIQEKDIIEVFANAIRDTRNILNGGDEK